MKNPSVPKGAVIQLSDRDLAMRADLDWSTSGQGLRVSDAHPADLVCFAEPHDL